MNGKNVSGTDGHSSSKLLLTTYRCSFTFDPENFPDPAHYLHEIKEKYNVKICLWSEDFLSHGNI